MRCSVWSSLAISACSALALAAPAGAHVTAEPAFLAAGGTATLSLTGPNERDEPMTGFSLAVPRDFRIVAARSADGWSADVQEAGVSWSGGSLAPEADATFAVELEAPVGPGPAELQAKQLYAGGEVVAWPVALTVIPSSEPSSQNIGWAVLTAVVGAVVLTAIGLALLRRTRSLQEK
jgi:uncharacterized protein YndB with AHSA1/START domain